MQRTHTHTHTRTVVPTHSLIQLHTKSCITISPPTLLYPAHKVLYTQCRSWPWLLTPWLKINRVPPLIIHNLHVKFESDLAKTVVCIVSTWQSATDARRQARTDVPTHSPNRTQTAALLYPPPPKRCCEGIMNQSCQKDNIARWRQPYVERNNK